MKASEIAEILETCMFPDEFGGYICLREWRPSMGWRGDTKFIDLYALHCSPAKGLDAHAVEIKISRSDWLHELKQPLKQRMALAVSNFIWVAAPAGIVKIEELPPQWGLLEIRPDEIHAYEKVHQAHPADRRDKVRPTWALVASAIKTFQRNKVKK